MIERSFRLGVVDRRFVDFLDEATLEESLTFLGVLLDFRLPFDVTEVVSDFTLSLSDSLETIEDRDETSSDRVARKAPANCLLSSRDFSIT